MMVCIIELRNSSLINFHAIDFSIHKSTIYQSISMTRINLTHHDLILIRNCKYVLLSIRVLHSRIN